MSPKEEMDSWDRQHCRWLIIITAIISVPLGIFINCLVPIGLWILVVVGMYGAYGEKMLGVFNKR